MDEKMLDAQREHNEQVLNFGQTFIKFEIKTANAILDRMTFSDAIITSVWVES